MSEPSHTRRQGQVIEAQVEETALAVQEPRAAGLQLWSPEDLRATIAREKVQREIILEYVRGEMKEGQHYYTSKSFTREDGEEPRDSDRAEKPSLKKEGALNLAHLLHCRPRVAQREKETDVDGHFSVTTMVQLISLRTGEIVGEGEGYCSTRESKYAWRWLPEWEVPEAQRAGLKSRRVQIKRGARKGQWMSMFRFTNPDLADLFNTILKLSYKRALVAGVLTLPLVSEVFTQDVEDLEPEDEDEEPGQGGGSTAQPSTARPPAGGTSTPPGGGTPAPGGTPAAGKPAPAAPEGNGPLPTAEQVAKMPFSEVRNRIIQRLQLLSPGSDASAKQGRMDLVRSCFGAEVDTWPKVESAGLSIMRAGYLKLLAMRQETPPAAEPAVDDDVPLGAEAEAHLAGLAQEREAATEGRGDSEIGLSQDEAPGVSSGVPGAEPAMMTEARDAALELPPAVQVVHSTGYLSQVCVAAAASWVQRLGPGALAVWRDFLEGCQGGQLAPLMTPEQYGDVTQAILRIMAMERGLPLPEEVPAGGRVEAAEPGDLEDDDVPF